MENLYQVLEDLYQALAKKSAFEMADITISKKNLRRTVYNMLWVIEGGLK